MQNSGTRKCANDEALARIKEQVSAQKNYAEIMQEDRRAWPRHWR